MLWELKSLLDAVLMVPCVLVKGEPGNDGKPGRQGIPGNPGEKVGEEAPLCKHPLLSVRGPLGFKAELEQSSSSVQGFAPELSDFSFASLCLAGCSWEPG